MQRTDYDSVLLYLLNPYLLFFRREVESGAASLRLLCAALSSGIGYNLLFVFIIAYIDINVAPVLSSILTAKGDRVEPVLSKLSCQPKVKAIELLALAQRYMEHTHTKNIILDFLGRHHTSKVVRGVNRRRRRTIEELVSLEINKLKIIDFFD